MPFRAAIRSDRWTPKAWGYAAFASCVALVIAIAASSDDSGAVGGAFALGGLALGALGAGVGIRSELSDDDRQASLGKAVMVAIGSAGPVWVCLAVFYAVFISWHAGGERHGVAFAIGGSAVLVAGLAYPARQILAQEGVDRDVLLRSATFSFFATVLAALCYALFESLAGAPQLSMWAVWTFGMVAWGIATTVTKRRVA